MTTAPTVTNTLKRPGTSSSRRSARELLIDRYCELQPQLQRRFNALLHGELREELHAVTDHQRLVLTHLRGRSVTMRELATKLGVGESAATAVVERLVRQGLVLRCDDPSDRRVVRLALSHEGDQIAGELQAKACAKTASLLAVLSDEQLVQLVEIMETLDAAAAQEMSSKCRTAAHEDHKEQV